jgi:hypothetical protein
MIPVEWFTQWLPVIGYEGIYEVSDQGEVRSVDREVCDSVGVLRKYKSTVLKPRTNCRGYPVVNLCRNGRPQTRKVHQLVADAFDVPRLSGATEVCHLVNDRTRNTFDNLYWGTRSDNQQDRVRHGTHHGAIQTHCLRGHLYDDRNTYRDRHGKRQCRKCANARKREARLKRLDVRISA